jgi:hypothetical protein
VASESDRTKIKITDMNPEPNPKGPQKQQGPSQNKLSIPPKANRLLKVYDAQDRTPVVDTSEFTISELFMQDQQGFTLWTTVYVTLKEFSQSLWFRNMDADMKYTIEEGEGWFLINQVGQVVTAGKQVCVPRTNYHMILNNSQNVCVYRFECPGTMDLREYLGVPRK